MKNSFFVFIEIVFVLVFVFLCCIISFILFVADSFSEDITLSVFLTIMLVVIPLILLIWGVCIFAARIKVDNEGISENLFGLRIKHYSWEEIDEVKIFGNDNFVQSISFLKKRRNESPLFRWFKYQRIYFSCNNKKLAIINYFAPEYIKEKININLLK